MRRLSSTILCERGGTRSLILLAKMDNVEEGHITVSLLPDPEGRHISQEERASADFTLFS